jgi:glycosyltransferase involved in cell wall biosynthesis
MIRRLAHLTTVDMSLALLLETELRANVAAGHEVFALSAPGPFVPQIEAFGVRHVPVHALTRKWAPADDVRAAAELYQILRRLHLDVLHTHTPKAGVLGRIVGRAARVPVVVNTCHGLWAAPDASTAKRILVQAIEGVAARFSDFELYQNDEDRQTMRVAVPACRARTVGNGVDLRRFVANAAGRARLRQEFGISADELLVGAVGRVVVEKGIEEFAVSASKLRGRARFVWVGPSEEPDTAVRRDPDSRPEVQFVGAREDMPDVYSAFDLFVLPSHREGFSRSAMEAAACGLPMVLTDIRGCREIGVHGEHLVLVPPRDPDALTAAISALLDDPSTRARLGHAARVRAIAAFDQEDVAQASMETYDLVARRKGL